MKIKVLVATHKPGFVVSHEQYLPIHVGSKISSFKLSIQRDDDGKNISDKNGSYCELTALYWAWKNLKGVDIIGLSHYRRFFNFYDSRQWPVENRPESEAEGFNYTIPDSIVDKVLKGDVVVPSPWFSADTVVSQYCRLHYFSDMKALKKLISDACDQKYVDAFHVTIENSVSLHPLNMFIMRWSDFDSLCSWLFPLLEKYEKVTDISNYSIQQKRLYGYVAERLLNTWYYANRKRLIETSVTMFASDRGMGMSRFTYLKDAWKCRLSRFVADWRSYKSW